MSTTFSRPALGRGAVCAFALLAAIAGCSRGSQPPQQQTYPTPEAAATALVAAVKANDDAALVAMFGPENRDLIAVGNPGTRRRGREVFVAAAGEHLQWTDAAPGRKELVVGNEAWPFPIPLVQEASAWRFDTAAGREEVLARRIGRNELGAIRIVKSFVAAQRAYALTGHDGQRPGVFARRFRSDAGKENGLYWPTTRGKPRSPLGDLMAEAAADGAVGTTGVEGRAPFYGYYFRVLEAQGAAAPGGAKDYVVDGVMTGGFALVAWPATYDSTGVMTLVVNQDGVVHEKDLGPDTAKAVAAITRYDPDTTWARAEQ